MRSVQSAYSFSMRVRPVRTETAFIEGPTCADLMRRSHAATDVSNAPSEDSISRVGFVADLVAGFAAVGFHRFNPQGLIGELFGNAVALFAGAGEIALRRNVSREYQYAAG